MTPDKRTSLDCEPNAVGPATGRVAGSRLPLCSLLLCMLALGPAAAAAQETGDELRCELGEVSSIEVRNGSVFDERQSDSRLLRWGLSAANTLHMRTRATFIRDELLFKSGDCIDPIRVRESERLLEAYPTLRDVQIDHVDDGVGQRRVIVTTWDEWSTQIDLGATYDAGPNVEKLQVTERNFLGRAMFAEYTYRRRREVAQQSLGFSTPRFFGRANFGFTVGRRRAGDFIYQKLEYPFVGEVGRVSLWQHYERGSQFFSWATAGQAEASHVLVGVTTERLELSGATQFGQPGGLTIVGLAFTHERLTSDDEAQLALNDDFDDREGSALPASVTRQLPDFVSNRIALRLGWRRFGEYRRFDRFDNMGRSAPVPLGWFASLSLGHALSLPGLRLQGLGGDGAFLRGHVAITQPLGPHLFHVNTTLEGRRDDAQWRDVLGQSDMVTYLPLHRAHTVFLRASAAFGHDVRRPFQLALGGREGVRSLPDDAVPGSRMVRFTVEDRINPDWASFGAGDLGLALFVDAGRMWAGDVPYGQDSRWHTGVGAGLRVAMPSGSRNVTRFDMVWPVGPQQGQPIFRITAELNTLGSTFGTPKLQRSFRMLRAAEHY
jgi:hypothetical protein